ncbi:MAG: AAA family ATPase [Promethearchaeota archaeon]
MKFISIKLKNFKPYCDIPNKNQEITLFDEDRDNKNITLNIGQTGHGKTSISEAILWCLYGESYYKNWEDLVNNLSKEITRAKKDREVKISVELKLEVEGEHYKVIRTGYYDVQKGEKTSGSELYIILNGEPINDPEAFINKNFLTVTLMKYFIFDADDILRKFQENREGTIKDHINKIVGVERLDDIINSLEKANFTV